MIWGTRTLNKENGLHFILINKLVGQIESVHVYVHVFGI